MFSVTKCLPAIRGQRSKFVLCVTTLLFLVSAQLFAFKSYDSKSFADISAGIEAIGQAETVFIVSNQQRISRDITIPANITLKFVRGGSLVIDNGKTVNVQSMVQAEHSRIFNGPGTVVIKKGEVLPHWWGAKGDGIHDDGFAIQDAINSVYAGGGGTVRLPKGTYLLSHISGAYYALKSKDRVSVLGEGKDSILKVGSNLRTATRGVAVLYNHEEQVSNCRFAHFSVDYNGEANLRLESWGDARASNVSRLGAEFASDVLVDHVDFKNVTGAHCVYFGNHPTNSRNTISNCNVLNVGQSVAGNQLADHSSIYIGGTHGQVTGNTFYNQIPCNVSTAIEVHSSDTNVSDNRVTNYATAVNIAGEDNDCSDVVLTNNVFKNCRNGVVLWHYASFNMHNIQINTNTISIREPTAPYPPSFGIIYGNGYVTSKSNMRDLKIVNNTIYQESINSTSTKPNTAIHLESADNVFISRNSIYDFKGEAIYVQSRSSSQGMNGMRIYGNKIKDVGRTTSRERKRAIVFNAYQNQAGSIDNISLQNNTITCATDNPMINGITFNSGYFPHVTVSGNTITGSTSFELVNYSPPNSGVFQIDHTGKGSPVNILWASNGSKWTDKSTGRIFIYNGGTWK